MRLYLSSQGFGNYVSVLHDMVGPNKHIVFIDNAKDYYTELQRSEHLAEKRSEYETAGFTFEELDLRDYFSSPNGLSDIVARAGIIFVSGGNTFILRRAFKQSGFDALITDAVVHNQVVYAGSSAGSILATPTLHGTEHGDEPELIPEGYTSDIVWDGLNFIPQQIIPHVGEIFFNGADEKMISYFKEKNMPYEALRDGEVYIVNGSQQEKLS